MWRIDVEFTIILNCPKGVDIIIRYYLVLLRPGEAEQRKVPRQVSASD